MARHEADREDLMAEAVALARRVECRFRGDDRAVIGQNHLGWLFVYLGQDVMYRFDEEGRLRRAFRDGLLYRSEGHTLACLRRQRTEDSSELLRYDLNPQELALFQTQMKQELHEVASCLIPDCHLRQHPDDDVSLLEEFGQALARVQSAREFLAPKIVRR